LVGGSIPSGAIAFRESTCTKNSAVGPLSQFLCVHLLSSNPEVCLAEVQADGLSATRRSVVQLPQRTWERHSFSLPANQVLITLICRVKADSSGPIQARARMVLFDLRYGHLCLDAPLFDIEWCEYEF
jgi:hypothetical protein